MKLWSVSLLALTFVVCAPTRVYSGQIDLNDFFADPTVIVAADGSMATFAEDPGLFTVILSNDPGFGDPNVIIPAADTTLTFDYSFSEAPGEDDEFGAFILDGNTGLSVAGFEFFTQDTSSGSVSFDISDLTGQTLGLQFQLTSGFADDTGFSSTLEISNVALVETTGLPISGVPEPTTLALFAIGAIGLVVVARRRQRLTA
jgi:hypothetical protein